jgi:transposase
MPKIQKRKQLTAKEIASIDEFIRYEASSKKETCRAQAILFLNDGYDSKMILRFTCFTGGYAYELTQRFKLLGIEGLRDRKKKRPKNLLTKNQREEIKVALKQDTPRQYGYDCDYWTTGVLANVIEERFNVRYKSKTSYYVMFKDARISFRKPDSKYQKRDEAVVAQWKKDTQPIIAKALADENTVVLCSDEMVISSATTFQKVWLPMDDDVKIEVTGKRDNRSIYGFLDIKTGHQYAFKRSWQNMYETVEVLKALRKEIKRKKIVLCWDNAPWHRGSKVTEFIAADGNIEIIWFPPYSPEENPQEHVWKAGRAHVTHNKLITDIEATADKFVDYLNTTHFKYKMF